MQHPFIVNANANAKFDQMVKEAAARRQVRKVLGERLTFWTALASKFQPDYRQTQNQLDEASIFEGTS